MSALTVKKILSWYAGLLTFSGATFNVLNVFVCTRKKLRGISTFIIVAFISLSDSISLFTWTFQAFMIPFGVDINHTLVGCRLNNYLMFTTSEYSSWLLVCYLFRTKTKIKSILTNECSKVLISVDRFLSVKFIKWNRDYFHDKIVIVFCLLILVMFSLLNGHMLFMYGYSFSYGTNGSQMLNGSDALMCGARPYYDYSYLTLISNVNITITLFISNIYNYNFK